MDISSTTSSAATMSTADTNASSQAQKSSKSDSSFKEEMEKVSTEKKDDVKETEANKTDKGAEDKVEDKNSENSSKTDDKINNKDKNTKDTALDSEQTLMLSGEINISALHKSQNSDKNLLQIDNIQTLMDANRQLANLTMMNNSQAAVKVDYSNIEISSDDAVFFADLVQNTDKTLQNVAADLQSGIEQNVQQASKNVKVSATLMNALNEAVKTNQPFRINFDKDVSVVIRVDKDGALSATFIPGDKAVEEYLKQNISFLRQRFDEQELSYKDLSYSRQKQNQEQNRKNNKENNHE